MRVVRWRATAWSFELKGRSLSRPPCGVNGHHRRAGPRFAGRHRQVRSMGERWQRITRMALAQGCVCGGGLTGLGAGIESAPQCPTGHRSGASCCPRWA